MESIASVLFYPTQVLGVSTIMTIAELSALLQSLLIVGMVMIAFACLYIFMGHKLQQKKKWALTVIKVLLTLNLLGGVWSIYKGPEFLFLDIGTIFFSLAVVCYATFSNEMKLFFQGTS